MSKTAERWRLIVDSPCDGPTNMAIDEAILEAVGRGDMPPTLRLFAWEPACLSLGYAQPAADVDAERLAAHGWDIVRRMTGGRAILHTDELTYSVALPQAHPLVAGTIPDSYRRLSMALLHALERLGVPAHADKVEKLAGTAVSRPGPVCFEVPSNYEITANGKKLIGSAQVRKHDAALQHGSLPLQGDLGRICDALVFRDEAARQDARSRVTQRATTLLETLQHTVTWEAAANAVRSAFAETFSLELEEAGLSAFEVQRTRELRRARYACNDWTCKL